jgi:hypothetical protein
MNYIYKGYSTITVLEALLNEAELCLNLFRLIVQCIYIKH